MPSRHSGESQIPVWLEVCPFGVAILEPKMKMDSRFHGNDVRRRNDVNKWSDVKRGIDVKRVHATKP